MRENQKFAYVRVSSKSQSIRRQLELLHKIAPDILKQNIYIEKVSGASTKGRSELRRLLDRVRAEDVIYVHSIDRLGRNLLDILQIIQELDKKDVRLVSISQNIDSSTQTGKMFIMFCGMMAEMELMFIKERTAEGVGIAKRNKKMGRPKRALNSTEVLVLEDYLESRKTATDCMELLKISRATFFRRLQEYKDSQVIEKEKWKEIKENEPTGYIDELLEKENTDNEEIDFDVA